jgi:hypothetical protein
MPADALPAPRARRAAVLLLALALAGCEAFNGAPRPAAEAAPAPVAAPPPATLAAAAPAEPKPDLATASDQVARRLLAFHEHLLQIGPAELAANINLLDGEVAQTSSAAAPDVVLDLALALAQQHAPGDLARASGLLEAITQAQSSEIQPWQPLARLLAGAIAEQRRLEDQLEQSAAQRRETQRAIQQLTEKLEALKAIERSMNKRSAGAAKPAAPGEARNP